MTATYTVSGNLAVKRIRCPHSHDVLLGRGGGINSHEGNKTFRQYVRQRKHAYNTACSKEKVHVAKEVIAQVKALNPPGRFLQRDPNSSGVGGMVSWWVEVDESRAIAKTSQALREGAPQMRAVLKDADGITNSTVKAKTRMTSKITPPTTNTTTPTFKPVVPLSKPSSTKITTTPAVARPLPLVPNTRFQETFGLPSAKRLRVEEKLSLPSTPITVPSFVTKVTPPLTSLPAPATSIPIPPLVLGATLSNDAVNGDNVRGLKRNYSIALSEFSVGELSAQVDNDDFVNPFVDNDLGSTTTTPYNFYEEGSVIVLDEDDENDNKKIEINVEPTPVPTSITTTSNILSRVESLLELSEFLDGTFQDNEVPSTTPPPTLTATYDSGSLTALEDIRADFLLEDTLNDYGQGTQLLQEIAV